MIIKSTSVNIRNVEFITGNDLEILKKETYNNTRGNPMVNFDTVLENFEIELSNYTPTQKIYSQIKKYTTDSNIYLVEVSDAYKYRPDLLSYIFYGTVEHFHIILLMNQMKSLLEFVPSNTNNLIFVFKSNVIDKVTTYK